MNLITYRYHGKGPNDESISSHVSGYQASSAGENRLLFENANIDVDEYKESGIYKLQNIQLSDDAQNANYYDRKDLFDLGYDLDLFDIEN